MVGATQTYLTYNTSDSVVEIENNNQTPGYIDLPVNVQYNIHSFYIGAGAGVSFKIFTKGGNQDFNSAIQTVDVSANLLLGYKFVKEWDINIRYN